MRLSRIAADTGRLFVHTTGLTSRLALARAIRRGDSTPEKVELTMLGRPFLVHLRGKDVPELRAVLKGRDDVRSPVRDHPIIIDVGAHIGLSSLWYLARFPWSRVHAFEWDEARCELFKENIRCERECTFMRKWIGEVDDGDFMSLQGFMKLRNLKKGVDVLRINTGGSELEVIKGAGERLTEINTIVGCVRGHQVDEFFDLLDAKGYRVVKRDRIAPDGSETFEVTQ